MNRDFFPVLVSGHENTEDANRRQIAFRKCWAESKSRIDHLLNPLDTAVLGDIVQFVKDAPTPTGQERLRTGIIFSGPKARSHTSLLDQWRSTYSQKRTAIVVSLNPSQAPNLITGIKNLIRAAIHQLDGPDGYQTFLNDQKRRIHMNYDLELLQEFILARGVQKCVVYLTDIEAFEVPLLADLITVITSWKDRIPFVLLLGLSTAVELFEARLPKSIIRLLDCRLFDASPGGDHCLQMYQSLQSRSDSLAPVLGPVASGVLFEMSRDQDASAASFSLAIKYAVMTHFFANALSILLEQDAEDVGRNQGLCEAIRSTGSFRTLVEQILHEGDANTVRSLLNDDKALLSAAKEAIHDGQKAMALHYAAVDLFELLSNLISLAEIPPDSFSIQVQALAGSSFLEKTLYTNLISKITALRSDQMRTMLETIKQRNGPSELDVDALLTQLNHITPANAKVPLRSAYDPAHATTSATVKNNKVSLSKHGPKLAANEIAYTRLLDQIVDRLSSYFETHIRDPTTLFMHEAFVYDLKIPLATAFAPRPRHATERALATPYDYLGCACCEGPAAGQISASQPPTSILWQLWCEAGGTVNARDLWDAFSAIVVDRRRDASGQEEEEEGEEDEPRVDGGGGGGGGAGRGIEIDTHPAHLAGALDERTALALFYSGLAELRMMGFVKPTKRKADCLAKTAWRGL